MRVIERDTIQLFIGCIAALIVVAFLSNSAHAAIKIDCQTAFGEKNFTIQDSSIAFHQESDAGRSISSTLEAVTQKTYKGFRKTLYIDGNKHLISISNVKRFDDSQDYLAVTSPKGHKMTYPLTCSTVE